MRALTACLLLLLAAASAAAPQRVPYDTSAAPRIEFVEPPFTVPADLRDTIRFGWLTVPRDHNDPAAGTLRLALTVIAARTDARAADPIVFLPGGPGGGHVAGPAMHVARIIAMEPFRIAEPNRPASNATSTTASVPAACGALSP